MHTTISLFILLVFWAISAEAQCSLNGYTRLYVPLVSPSATITFDDLGLEGEYDLATGQISSWGGGVTIEGSGCSFVGYAWGFGLPSWISNELWFDGIGKPNFFIGAESPESHCEIRFASPIAKFVARAAADSTGPGEIVAKDVGGNPLACVVVASQPADAPDNYYRHYGIQSSETNIKSVVFRNYYIAVDVIEISDQIDPEPPATVPVSPPVEVPVAVPVAEPLATPIMGPVAVEVPVSSPVEEPGVAVPQATQPVGTSTPTDKTSSTINSQILVSSVGLACLALSCVL